MKDSYNRNINYMRVSLTERCNLRCRYCMPEDGIVKKSHDDMLTEDEIITAVTAAANLGITKIRYTGGEPLIKKNIVEICERTSQIEGIEAICITTNGILLPSLAKPLKEAGVSRLNLSLDSLNEEKYSYITRIGKLDSFKDGLHAALDAGFKKIKINAVLIGGFNDDEIADLADLTMLYPVDMRFIEMMPMYDSGDFDEKSFISYKKVLEVLPELEELPKDGSVAKLYHLPGAKGNIGLISPISAHFCGECNRIRLTADGKVKPCLHSNDEYSLKGLSLDGMTEVLKEAIWNKPSWHGDLDAINRSKAGRNMNQIGG